MHILPQARPPVPGRPLCALRWRSISAGLALVPACRHAAKQTRKPLCVPEDGHASPLGDYISDLVLVDNITTEQMKIKPPPPHKNEVCWEKWDSDAGASMGWIGYGFAGTVAEWVEIGERLLIQAGI